MELEVRWRQEHELGSYPTMVLTWEDAMRGAPGKYLDRCEGALFEFTEGETPCDIPIRGLRIMKRWKLATRTVCRVVLSLKTPGLGAVIGQSLAP